MIGVGVGEEQAFDLVRLVADRFNLAEDAVRHASDGGIHDGEAVGVYDDVDAPHRQAGDVEKVGEDLFHRFASRLGFSESADQ